MRTIVGIFGKQFRGKTSVANQLRSSLPGFKINPLALPVKQEYAELAGISLNELEKRKRVDKTVRAGLQALGHGKRQDNPNYWINKCLAYPGDMIIDDIRYFNEIEMLQDNADVFYLIKVECPRTVVVEQQRGTLSGEDHVTETQLDEFDEQDLLINNEGTLDDLESQSLWAAHDILFSIQHACGLAQREVMDGYTGIESV